MYASTRALFLYCSYSFSIFVSKYPKMNYSRELYEARIADLFERHQSVQSVGFNGKSYKPGLDAMIDLDRALGFPSSKFKSVHVAGTNGKGSVCSMLAAALAADGLKVGLYTSPHLLDFRERMRIIGQGMIDREDVWDFLEMSAALLDGRSFFEVTTAMAFWWFAKEEVDVAVIETGLGGRLDSTNIITPEISVVTSIGLDHCAILGGTREAIAGEKAGIFKPGVPAVVGERDEETAGVFERKAVEMHCPLFFADDFEVPELTLDLKGPCQQMNLRTVLAALEILGIEPDLKAISEAGARTCFRGRWEKVKDNPETICDIGHNPPALKENFGRLETCGRPVIIVYGVMADKDLDGIAPMMPPHARYVLVAPQTARSLPVDALRERLGSLRPDLEILGCGTVAEGVDIAEREALADPDTIIYIGGSTFVVSEAIQHIEKP